MPEPWVARYNEKTGKWTGGGISANEGRGVSGETTPAFHVGQVGCVFFEAPSGTGPRVPAAGDGRLRSYYQLDDDDVEELKKQFAFPLPQAYPGASALRADTRMLQA
jgi:hypothetical protein